MAKQDILVPDIGDYKDVDVIEVSVAVGDKIQVEDTLISLETDKATMEIPAPMAGTVAEILVKEGDTISEGGLILRMETDVENAVAAAPESQPEVPKQERHPDDAKHPSGPISESSSSNTPKDVLVPDIGDYTDVDVIEISVAVGDEVQAEDTLISLETDKATMEIPAPFAGKVTEISVKEGDKVSEGGLILKLATAGGSAAAVESDRHSDDAQRPSEPISSDEAPKQERHPDDAQHPSGPISSDSAAQSVYASPAIRRFGHELGVDLSKVSGTGRKGRITKEDVQKFVKGVMTSAPSANVGGAGLGLLPDPVVDFAKFGEIETEKLSRIKKISGDNLARNWVRIPHITLFDDANITELEAFRKGLKARAEKSGVKITPVPFIIKAVAGALREFPLVNSSLTPDGGSLVKKKYVHIGVAVDTPNGLMVPVIRNADQKGVFEIAKDLTDLATKAKEGKLKGDDMQGGCFTISSLGVLGTKYFTPIVNMPEVGILGVSRAEMKPNWNGEEFVPGLMLPLSLSLDHRVVDGAEGAKFLTSLVRRLSDLKESIL